MLPTSSSVTRHLRVPFPLRVVTIGGLLVGGVVNTFGANWGGIERGGDSAVLGRLTTESQWRSPTR